MNIEEQLLNLHVRFLELQDDESNYALRQQSIILNRIEEIIKKNKISQKEIFRIIEEAEIKLQKVV